MLCKQCGKWTDVDFFCPYCGWKLDVKLPFIEKEQDKLIVTRKERDSAGFMKLKVRIDEGEWKKIKPGQSIEYLLPSGYHKITVQLNMMKNTAMFLMPSEPILVEFGAIHLPDGKGGYVEKENNADVLALNTDVLNVDKPVFSLDAKSQMKNKGTLDIYRDCGKFLLPNGSEIVIDFSEVTDVTTSLTGIKFFVKGKPIAFYLSKKYADDIADFVKEQSKTRVKQKHPEFIFDNEYGFHDKILINDEYGTFCIRYGNAPNGPIYKMTDILGYEFQELGEEKKDTLTGILVGGAVAGVKGALVGSMFKPSKGTKVIQIIFRVSVKSGKDIKTETASFAYSVFGVEKTSRKYIAFRNEVLRLDSYLSQFLQRR